MEVLSTRDHSRAWLNAIQDAMACMNTVSRPLPQDAPAAAGTGKANNDVQSSINYLALLETVLLQEYENWNQVPTMDPPQFKGGRRSKKKNTDVVAAMSNGSTRNGGPYHSPTLHDDNYFAGFRDDDEDDDDDDDDEGGDVVLLNRPINTAPSTGLAMRRLAIRIMTAQSELYAYKASQYRNERPRPQWKLGAETYQSSWNKINGAIQLADSEISRLFALGQQATDLAEDANVVHVAISYFSKERDKFRHAAQAYEQSLLAKLQPQWSSRDDARNRIGMEKWINNPNPRNDYRKKRLLDERQLKDVQAALKDLMEMDTAALEEDAQQLQHRLLQEPHDELQRRYNGLRPSEADLLRRVSWQDYPDPTNFGWNFTGSWQYAEFFEKDDVKLDWYYTTGTIKTSMDHPTQGRTQLFGSRVTPQVYRQILMNPRQHTNVRYQKRPNKTNGRAKQQQ